MFTKHLLLLIQSYINYGNIAWASTKKTKLKKLFGKQTQVGHI